MLSKWTAWDFVKSQPQIISPTSAGGLHGFWISDSYVERFILDRLKLHWGNVEKRILLGSDITLSWVEDNLMTLSLFGGSEHIVVLHADEISSSVLEYWEKNAPSLDERHVVFFFRKSGKASPFENWSKKINGNFTKIEDAAFWQGGELFNFLSQEMKVLVPYEVKDYLLNSLDHETSLFVSALEIIRHSFEDPSKAELRKVEELIVPMRFDKFKMASMLAGKDYKNFWRKTVSLDSDQVRELFNFLQGHLMKVASPDVLIGKARDSKYGKEILAHARLWKPQEIAGVIRACAEMEVDAKNVKNSFLHERLRRAYLKTLR